LVGHEEHDGPVELTYYVDEQVNTQAPPDKEYGVLHEVHTVADEQVPQLDEHGTQD